MDNFDLTKIRMELENSNILQLVPAARACGVSFRNGLKKSEIVALLATEGKLAMVWTKLHGQPVQEQERIPEQPVPSPAPVPVPVPTPSPVTQIDPDNPAAAIAALLTGLLNKDQVARIARDEAKRLIGESPVNLAKVSETALRIVQEELAKSPTGTVIHLPEKKDPIKLPEKQHRQFGDLLLCLQQGLNVYLVGGAGTGKTHAAEHAALALETPFFAQGAVTYAHELLGYIDAHSKYVRTQFREAFEHGGLILLDEFDASSPEAALVVNSALSSNFCPFPDAKITKHPGFRCIVGANTDGSGATMAYSGRARMDGAFLDRFVQINWELDPQIEKNLAKGKSEWLDVVKDVRRFVKERQIHDVAATIRAVDYGSTLLHAGMKPEKVLDMCLCRGALVKEWPQIKALPSVKNFLVGF